MLADGRMSYKRWFGRQGLEWRTEIRQVETEEAFCLAHNLQRIVTQRGNVVLSNPADVTSDDEAESAPGKTDKTNNRVNT